MHEESANKTLETKIRPESPRDTRPLIGRFLHTLLGVSGG